MGEAIRRAVLTGVTASLAKPVCASYQGKIFDKTLSNEERCFQTIDDPADAGKPVEQTGKERT